MPYDPTASLVQATGLRRVFRMGDTDVTVLKNVSLDVKPGEFVAIEGRSGSGKSTLLHILGALDSVDAGTTHFDGVDYTSTRSAPKKQSPARAWLARHEIAGLVVGLIASVIHAVFEFLFHLFAQRYIVPVRIVSIAIVIFFAIDLAAKVGIRYFRERPKAQLRNTQFGFVFQFYYLLPELNVLENTMLAPMIEQSWFGFRSNRKALRARAIELLKQFGLEHRLTHRSTHLSGGERQRVAIARALMNQPRVLFADEPTGNLDDETGKQIMGVLEILHREHGQTIVMVTHDRTLAKRADRVLVLKDGALEPAE